MRVFLLAVFAVVIAPLAAAAQSFSQSEEDEIRRIVRDYLISNPEVIEEAIVELQARREIERAERERAALVALHDDIFNDPRDFSVGPVDAPVQIAEFFDYNCPYCRASAPWVKSTLETYPNLVRFVFKEAPIFADSRESSDLASRAAVASIADDRYLELHFALMATSGTIPISQVRQIAEGAGINWRRAQSVMDSPETTQHLDDGLDLLDAIGATGTPAFVINGELVTGADFDRLDQLVAAAFGEGE
jgi:protein-disulfide isomerase